MPKGRFRPSSAGCLAFPAPSGWASESRDVSVQALRIDTPIRRVHHDSMTLPDDPPPAATSARSAPTARAAIVTCYAMRWAASNAHADVIHALLSAGADLHAANESALRNAACHRRTLIARILLQSGADMNGAWANIPPARRPIAAIALDACADAMAPAQRIAFATQSKSLVGLCAMVHVQRQRQPLLR